MKWDDKEGKKHEFRLIKKVSSRWWQLGLRFMNADELEVIDIEYQGNSERCWGKVIEKWLDKDRRTWDELYEILEDIGCSEVAGDLRNAVAARELGVAVTAVSANPT